MNLPRNIQGKFISNKCTDPNCNGVLHKEGDWFRCDGLTYLTDNGPLVACEKSIAPPYLERNFLNWQKQNA